MQLESTNLASFPRTRPRRTGPFLAERRRILLCDDAPEARLILRRILLHSGFSVLEAGTGAEALRLLRQEPGVGLMLLDLVIPDMDGFAVLQELAALRERPRVCVISALGDRKTVDRALALDADDYLVKPIFPRDVLHKARSLLAAPGEEEDDGEERLPCRLDALVKAGRASRSATVSSLSDNGLELRLESDATGLPDHARLMCPALWRSIDHFDDVLGGVQLRIEGTRRDAAGLVVRADFVGLPEPVRRKLRQAVRRQDSLADGATLH